MSQRCEEDPSHLATIACVQCEALLCHECDKTIHNNSRVLSRHVRHLIQVIILCSSLTYYGITKIATTCHIFKVPVKNCTSCCTTLPDMANFCPSCGTPFMGPCVFNSEVGYYTAILRYYYILLQLLLLYCDV